MAFYPCLSNGGGEDVTVIAPDYNIANTYNKEDVVLYSGVTYMCNTDGTTGTWNSTFWDKVYISELTDYNSNLGGKTFYLSARYGGDGTINYVNASSIIDITHTNKITFTFVSKTSNPTFQNLIVYQVNDITVSPIGGTRIASTNSLPYELNTSSLTGYISILIVLTNMEANDFYTIKYELS